MLLQQIEEGKKYVLLTTEDVSAIGQEVQDIIKGMKGTGVLVLDASHSIVEEIYPDKYQALVGRLTSAKGAKPQK